MNATNGTAPTPEQVTLAETAFYLVNGTVGTIFNVLVLFIAFRYIDTDDKPRQIIVMNMTAADLLMCIVYMLSRPFLVFIPSSLCVPYYVIIWTTQLCSTLNLVWLNLDKLLYIQFPLHYYSIVNRQRMLTLSIVSWVVLGSIAFTNAGFMEVGDNCITVSVNFDIYLVILMLYAIMILASFIITAIIYIIAHNSTKMEARQRTKLFQRLFFLFSSTLWTTFTCLPYRALYLAVNLVTVLQGSQLMRDITNMFFRILVIGMVINPVITIWTQRIYRSRLLRIINRMNERSSFSDEVTTTIVGSRRMSSKSGGILENVALTSHV